MTAHGPAIRLLLADGYRGRNDSSIVPIVTRGIRRSQQIPFQ